MIRHFGRRGRECLSSLRNISFQKATGRERYCYMYYKIAWNEIDKTPHGVAFLEKTPRMYEQEGHCNCSVTYFAAFLSLNPEWETLFQRPLLKVQFTDPVWYIKVHLGVNTLYTFRACISVGAKLSRRYSNHCLRAVMAITFHSAGVSGKGTLSVTGHRNVQSKPPVACY